MDATIVKMHHETRGGETLSVLHIAREDGKQASVRVHSIAGQKVPRTMEGKSWAVRLVTSFLVSLDPDRRRRLN